MKIIRLGHYDVQFVCGNCKTLLECSTDEFEKIKDGEWEVRCPICNFPFVMKEGDERCEILKYREMLNKENQNE